MGTAPKAIIPDNSFVDMSVEAAWERLRNQLELVSGFWLAFIFSASPLDVDTLRKDTADFLTNQKKTIFHRKLDDPQSIRDLLPFLLADRDAQRADCVWLESIISDSIGARETPFLDAWKEFVLRANQKRDVLRQKFRGGLVFAAPPIVKEAIRDAAPDLWSIRALVIDVVGSTSNFLEVTFWGPSPLLQTPLPPPTASAVPLEIPVHTPPPTIPQLDEHVSGPVTLRHQSSIERETSEPTVLGPPVPPPQSSALPPLAASPLLEQTRRNVVASRQGEKRGPLGQKTRYSFTWAEYETVDWLIANGQSEDAEAHALSVLESVQPDRVLDSAFAHHLLSVTYEKLRHYNAALDEMEEALRAYLIAAPKYVPIEWYLRAAHLAAQPQVRDPRAMKYFSTAVDECHKRIRESETVDSLRSLISALQGLGDWKNYKKDHDGAGMAFLDAVSASRRLLDIRGEDDVDSIAHLLTSLVRFGDICRNSNKISNATAAFQESVRLARKLCHLDGENWQSLSQLATTLNRVGGLLQNMDEWEQARLTYRESLKHRRRVVQMKNDQHSNKDLISVLKKLVTVETHLGNDVVAAKLAQELQMLEKR